MQDIGQPPKSGHYGVSPALFTENGSVLQNRLIFCFATKMLEMVFYEINDTPSH